MQLISGIAPLENLAKVVSSCDPYPGQAMKEKLLEVLQTLSQIFVSGKRKWNFQASLSSDASLLYTHILSRAQVSSLDELKNSPVLWREEEKGSDLPQQFQQIVATFVNICLSKNPLIFPYYHPDLLLSTAPTPSRETVHAVAEERLKKAFEDEKKGYFLLRDCSSFVQLIPDFQLFVASTINSQGKFSHRCISYYNKKGKWIINTTSESFSTLNAAMKHITGEAVEGIPLVKKEKILDHSGSY